MVEVHGPDGSVIRFPDGTTPQAIQAALAKHFGAPTPTQAKAQADARQAYQSRYGDAPAALHAMNAFSVGHLPQIDGALAALDVGGRNLVGAGPGYSAADAYQATRDTAKQMLAQSKSAHPGLAAGGDIAGALMSPAAKLGGEWIGGAKGLLGTIARSAAVGGATGGSMEGPKGILPGAVTGAALPVAAAGVGAVVRRAGNAAGTLAQGVKTALVHAPVEASPTPADTLTAAQKIAQLVRASGKTVADLPLHPAAQAGLPVTTAEAIGRPGVSALGVLARRVGKTPDALQATLADRVHATPARIQTAFQAASGIDPAAASGDIDGLISSLQAKAKPLYDAALSSPDAVWNPDLAKLAGRPVIKKAIASVGNDLLNAGKDPNAMGLALDPETGWRVTGSDLASATEPQPTAQTWDLVKKSIGRQIERHPITGRPLPDSQSEGNYGVRVASQDLTDALAGDPANGQPGAIPGYRAALDQAGDYLKLSDAFDKGGRLLTDPAVNEGTFADVYGNLGDAEQQAFKGGFANKLFDLAQNGRLTPRTFLAPRVQQKVTAVIGPDAAEGFLDHVDLERDLAATGNRMAPGAGSPTAEFANAGAEQEHGAGALGLVSGLAHNPLKLVKGLSQVGADAPTTPQVRDEMGRLLMQHPEATAAELQTVLGAAPTPAPPVNLGQAAGQAVPVLTPATAASDQN